MKNIFKCLFIGLLSTALMPLTSCSGEDGESITADDFRVSISLPSTVDVVPGGECVFNVNNNEAPQNSDRIILESVADGISYVCTLSHVTLTDVKIQLPSDCTTGYYDVSLKRAERKKLLGRIYISIASNLDFTLQAGTTIYGKVTDANAGIANVVVSDGEEVVTTNAQGIYQLRSKKSSGYVFISIPSGYEVEQQGVLPQFCKQLKAGPKEAERIDFGLNKVSGQDNYKLFVLGDMHLANRNGDLNQFDDFCRDLNAQRATCQGQKVYALTLGDMTWDIYWYSNNYGLPQYLSTVNSGLSGLTMFHTMGNHDNNYQSTSDLAAESEYRSLIAPTYYSFNLGKVHYVVLDDIDCDTYDGTADRNYVKRITSRQLEWLEKDLSYVPKSIPIVMAMHAQVYYPTATGFKVDHDSESSNSLFSLLSGYTVHFVTGHTHYNFNVTPEDNVTRGEQFFEHNTAAVCGSWWWSGALTPGIHLSPDGAPGGYAVWQAKGTELSYQYKSTGHPLTYQFRSYDLNQVHFSLADVPQMPANVSSSVRNKYMEYVNAFPGIQENEVLINIWNWNPRWTLRVTDEQGRELQAESVWAYDPLHIAAMSVKRFNNASLASIPNFITERFTHFFKVKAADANTDLHISVTDEFNNTYTEDMQRPKAFSIDVYKQ